MKRVGLFSSAKFSTDNNQFDRIENATLYMCDEFSISKLFLANLIKIFPI